METLRVWFYDPVQDTHGIFNKMVAYADPPFCHCELQFEDTTACSIYVGSKVIMKQRQFDPKYYTAVQLRVPREKADLAYALCLEKLNSGVSFSSMQMLSCLYPWRRTHTDKNYTFCSKLVTEMLVAAEVLPRGTSTNITPSALHRLIAGMQGVEQRKIDPLELKEGVELDIF